jgi:cell division protein FtsB
MKIKNRFQSYISKGLNYLQRLSDPRFAGQVLFVVIVLMVSWSGVKTIQTNYNLQKQITSLNQQNELQSLQNDNLALQNQYYNSNQYLELSARQNFGLAAANEKEVIVPASVAQEYEVSIPNQDTTSAVKSKLPAYQRNIESWVDFFMHRHTT